MKKSLVAICGSTRASSSNLSLINAIVQNEQERFVITVFKGIGDIPHFNPDDDHDHPPDQVLGFRNLLRKADGILICTPEYAMGVPGSLKNAIDWTVSSSEFSKKPTALITASSLGLKGHAALLETLRIIEADIPETSQLVISHVKVKVTGDAIIDVQTATLVNAVMNSLCDSIVSRQPMV